MNIKSLFFKRCERYFVVGVSSRLGNGQARVLIRVADLQILVIMMQIICKLFDMKCYVLMHNSNDLK